MIASGNQLLQLGRVKSQLAKEEEVQSSTLLRNSIVVQMILETVILNNMEVEENLTSSLEISNIVGQFIHQLFIETRLLCKLLHFQTYDIKLLPFVVNNVPSIHICLDFIKELIDQPNHQDRQIFGIILASFLVEKYPLARW